MLVMVTSTSFHSDHSLVLGNSMLGGIPNTTVASEILPEKMNTFSFIDRIERSFCILRENTLTEDLVGSFSTSTFLSLGPLGVDQL